jgi:hypothetical protein
MKKNPVLTLTACLILTLAAHRGAFAQELSFTDGSGTLSVSLNTLLTGATPGWTWESNLAAFSGPGWIHTDDSGTISLAASPLALDDPFITYSVAFQNTTGTNQSYSATFDAPFAPVTYSPSEVRAIFSGTIVDGTGNQNGSGTLIGVVGTPSQVTTLTLAAGGTVSAGVDLFPGSGTVLPGEGIETFSDSTSDYPSYEPGPTGTYNDITVRASVVLSPSAFIALVGRADVIPEPSTYALLLGGGSLLVLLLHRKRV